MEEEIWSKAMRYPRRLRHFVEMIRYDLLVDAEGKPWLVEVNMSPNSIPHGGVPADRPWRAKLLTAVARHARALAEARPVPSPVPCCALCHLSRRRSECPRAPHPARR